MKNAIRPTSDTLRNLLLTAVLATSATACAAHDASDTGDLGDPNVATKVQDLGLQMSASKGEPSPARMYAVAFSDHQAAELALGGGTVYDHRPVIVIVITGGHFTARGAPYGATPPEGTVLTVTLDAATYEATDVGISNEEPDLSQFASATVDLSAR